jgi:hypothetical protein
MGICFSENNELFLEKRLLCFWGRGNNWIELKRIGFEVKSIIAGGLVVS